MSEQHQVRENGEFWDIPVEVADALVERDVIYACDGKAPHDDACTPEGLTVYHVSNEWLDRFDASLNFDAWENNLHALIEAVSAELYLRDFKTTEALGHLESTINLLADPTPEQPKSV